jgi:glycosyltransferase involved in cell wall biosynthesis
MDGGSTDGSVQVLAQFAASNPHLCWVSEADGGQSHALQKALELVDTEFFGWLNADDVYLPGGIEALVKTLPSDMDTPPSILYGDYLVIDSEGPGAAQATFLQALELPLCLLDGAKLRRAIQYPHDKTAWWV